MKTSINKYALLLQYLHDELAKVTIDTTTMNIIDRPDPRVMATDILEIFGIEVEKI